MDALTALLRHQGFFTRADARDCGYAEREIDGLARAGIWVRIRRGYYVPAQDWAALDAVARHGRLSRAVLHSLGDAVVLSHVSGAIAHGVEVWGVDLARVHVTRLDGGAGRLEGDVVHHEGLLGADSVETLADEVRALPLRRCVIEGASRATNEAAVVMLDSALRLGRFDKDELVSSFRSMARWPFMQHLHVPLLMADARSQSVGESRGKVLFRVHRIPPPVLQYEVRDHAGVLRGTTDWAWPELRTLGEFDGRVKYGRLLPPGRTTEEELVREKEREDRLREITDFAMVRLTWDDYARPHQTAARLRRRLGRRAG